MRAIVTGGCGFIGSNLVDRLVELGHDVVVLDDMSTGLLKNHNQKASLFTMDVRNDLSWFPMLDCDVIFHLAAIARIQPSFKDPHHAIDVNCNGTSRVLELARKHNAKVVYAGSSSYYGGTHINPYAHSKWIGEEHCRMYNQVYGVSVAIPRFFNVYGPRHIREGDFATVVGVFEYLCSINKPLTITGTGEQRRDFTHVSDIVEAMIAMSADRWNAEVFNLGSGVSYSINEVAKMFHPHPVEYLPARPGEAAETLADISLAKEKLSWTPKKHLPDYIEEFMKGKQ